MLYIRPPWESKAEAISRYIHVCCFGLLERIFVDKFKIRCMLYMKAFFEADCKPCLVLPLHATEELFQASSQRTDDL